MKLEYHRKGPHSELYGFYRALRRGLGLHLREVTGTEDTPTIPEESVRYQDVL